MSIDRMNLVKRHNVIVKTFDEYSPLSVGNGELAFTADPTGFQTFAGFYENGIPLCTLSQWGWHTSPFDKDSFYPDKDKFKYTSYDTGGRKAAYPVDRTGQEKEYDWLRQNPHRMNLCKISLDLEKDGGHPFLMKDIANIEQKLDLYEGTIESAYSADGRDVFVKTCCHPVLDLIYFSVNSRMLFEGRMKFNIGFPYGSPGINASYPENVVDGLTPGILNATRIISKTGKAMEFLRIIDKDRYFVKIFCSEGVRTISENIDNNHLTLIPSKESGIFTFGILFSKTRTAQVSVSFSETSLASKKHWENFWNFGGAIELADSMDTRAFELERRIILSQYLTAIQCSGTLPPQETGLTCNSWYGKYHLEMHWFHAVHFALWNRPHLLERSMWWYLSIMDKAGSVAGLQGFTGARWPKMTSIEGDESPSFIGPFIIWQQPHPIYYAELLYRQHPSASTLEIYKDMVFETAEFMASFVSYNAQKDSYDIVPPVIPAQENHKPEDTINPCFELEYWYFGLITANEWKKRLGLKPDERWAEITGKLASLPVINGLYAAHLNCPDTFTKYNFDHPSMLAAYGMLPGNGVDKEIMNNTLDAVMKSWQMDRTWGWDFPLMAMTAVRLGRPETAIEALFYDSPKNTYLANGHNMQGGVKDLPVYLPGNGALLSAAGMMAAGWGGMKPPAKNAPGFPDNGKWNVKWENIIPII